MTSALLLAHLIPGDVRPHPGTKLGVLTMAERDLVVPIGNQRKSLDGEPKVLLDGALEKLRWRIAAEASSRQRSEKC